MRRRIDCRLVLFSLLLILCLGSLTGCPPPFLPTASPSPTGTAVPPTPRSPTASPAGTSSLDLFVLPDDGIEPILAALTEAEHSIHMVMYLLSEPSIIGALKDAARRGVETRLILEREPSGNAGNNEEVAAALQAAGVEVRWDTPAFKYTHAKLIVINRARLLLMTNNLTKAAFTDNREYGIMDVSAEDIAEVLRVFEADWARQPIDLDQSRLVWSPDNSRSRIAQLLDAARSTIDLEHQSCQDKDLEQRLISAARRGVRVRYVSSPRYPLSDDWNETCRQRLRDAGAEVRYLHDPYVHAKALVVDAEVAMVGSQNLTATSLDANREVGIVFTDWALIRRMLEVFEADWEAATYEAYPADAGVQPAGGSMEP